MCSQPHGSSRCNKEPVQQVSLPEAVGVANPPPPPPTTAGPGTWPRGNQSFSCSWEQRWGLEQRSLCPRTRARGQHGPREKQRHCQESCGASDRDPNSQGSRGSSGSNSQVGQGNRLQAQSDPAAQRVSARSRFSLLFGVTQEDFLREGQGCEWLWKDRGGEAPLAPWVAGD